MKNLQAIVLCIVFNAGAVLAQQPSTNWSVSFKQPKRFIENKSQFSGRNLLPGTHVLFATDQGTSRIFFTKNGLTYRFDELTRKPEHEEWKEKLEEEHFDKEKDEEEWEEREREEKEFDVRTDVVHMQWVNANPNVQVIPFEPTDDYFSYTFNSGENYQNVNYIKGYKRILYQNLYPNIDVEYTFHQVDGIKYSIILHPGADVSQIKMKYSETDKVFIDKTGSVRIKTLFGDITDHAPLTTYEAADNSFIPSRFVQHGKEISFLLDSYNTSNTVIIDPWTQTPNFATNWDCVWECDQDGAGNVYIIGGVLPLELLKYNAAGTLQWTYNTTYDSTSWLGTFATDNAGNSYVTNGSFAAIRKINTSGGLVWDNPNPGGIFQSTEFWNISFNCDQTKLVIAGTGGILPPLPYIYDINVNTGNVTTSVQVSGSNIIDVQEVRSITACYNAKYYYLTHDSIGYIYQGLTTCLPPNTFPFHVSSGFNLDYKCENWRRNNSGIMAIRYYGGFIYTHRGNQVQKRNFNTAAVITTAVIPGGVFSTVPVFGDNQVENSGIDIDDCGNVYVGSKTGVVKFDQNLNQLATYPTSFIVYDVKVSTAGNIIACGSNGNSSSSSRTGGVQSFAAGACVPQANICCDATICPAGPFCSTAAPITLTRFTPGGTWSGPGITNTSTGVFSPSVAGPGTHTITYTLPCGSDAVTIVVNSCATLSVCKEPNGDYTASGGTGPYTWETGASFQNCSGCPIPGFCIPIICPGFLDTAWTSFATGTTVTPPGTFPLRVRDSGVNSLIINSASTLPNCSTIVCPGITVTISSQSNITCSGAANGSATVSASGGTAPYTYIWQPGSLTGPTRNNLAPNTYTITATDANGCTGTTSVTITSPTAVSASTSKTDASCGGSDGTATASASGGTPNYTYSWSTGATTATITGLQAGNYTVTVIDFNNCSATATASISSANSPTITLVSKTDVSCFGGNDGAIDINVTGGSQPYTYSWTTGTTTPDLTGLIGGTYSVTVTDNVTCAATFSVIINTPAAPLSVTGVVTNAGCSISSGAINITASGGTPTYFYSWSSGSTVEDLSGILAGNYGVTVTDNNSCMVTDSFTVGAPGSFTVALAPDSASCNGVSDGSVTSNIAGGSAPYFYSWSTGATTQNISGVAAGTYTVTVTDNNLCSVTASTSVGAPTLISMTASITRVLCEGGNNGGIKLNPSGGTAPYDAVWNAGGSGLSLTNLAPGVYNTTVIDAHGCQKDSSFSLEAASTYQITTSIVNAACSGAASGSVTANILNGNTPPYSYSWSTSDSTAQIINVAPGVYSVTVSDSLHCLRMDTATVTAGNGLLISAAVINASCPESSDGSIATTVTGGTEPYQYIWNTGATTSFLQHLQTGSYSLTAIDQDDCTGSDTIFVQVDSSNLAACDTLVIYDVFSPNGDGNNDTWIIDGLDAYPNNELQIFNRWGSVVFEVKPYVNDWKGFSKKEEALPSATYYYILKLNDANKSIYSGHLTLIR